MTRTRHLNSDGTPRYTNRLARETSPYLRQHAHNPVDWYAWGPEAFAAARSLGRPVHLSVGYSACHWCHVMAEESFEDEATAQLLNGQFINIKVDREERPDVDRIYQIAQQLLTRRSGGWPLTMFLSPDDQRPFFGGTYFPREQRYGMPSFGHVLARVAEYYRDHREELRAQGDSLVRVLDELVPPAAGTDEALTAAPIAAARRDLADGFDREYGGFGGAPKFPHPNALERLLRDWHASSAGDAPDLQALFMATLTLRRMGEGGLNDQLGGGFCRYSVDRFWMIPHFEKMLYDNGGLLAVYAQAAIATGDPFYGRIAAATADWALREMRSPQGAFYSSLDADSEGHEGRFYVWDVGEVRELLPAAQFAPFAARFGLDREANFEGHWHLHAWRPLDEIARELDRTEAQVQDDIDAAGRTLLAARDARVRPGRDDKVLVSWNALLIRGLAIAARALGRGDWADAAAQALGFIRRSMWRDGRLLATALGDEAHLAAYLDDYAYLLDAILELQQVRVRSDELRFAGELAQVLLERFQDVKDGGFFFTADDHEQLIHRSKVFADDATPAGNAVAALALQRLGHLLGRPEWLAAAERTVRAGWRGIEQRPQGHVAMLAALEELLEPPQIIIVRGAPAQVEEWRGQLARLYAPRRLVLPVPNDLEDLPAALAEKPGHPQAVAYVCSGSTCGPPVTSLAQLIVSLRPA
ncbi:MAG TPA: thioredoxin domain-containing protein [Steroidobacteraceae bacterium]|nr:thioredoxin domain-containing protein [Steroidobacteraceae bacterium]